MNSSCAAWQLPEFDIQLHSHRHEWPLYDKELVESEVAENRRFLQPVVSYPLEHFCYPSGVYGLHQAEWLAELGVKSATTIDPGLNYRHTSRFALRRLVDGGPVSDIEFAAEMTGFMELVRLLRRRLRAGRGMTARKRVYRNEEGRPHLDPHRKSLVDARPRIFSGVRCMPAVHFCVAVHWRAGLVCIFAREFPHPDLGWTLCRSQLCLRHCHRYLSCLAVLSNRTEAAASYPASNYDVVVFHMDYVHLGIRIGSG